MSIRSMLSPHIRIDPETGFFFKRPDAEPHLSRAANLAIAMGALASRAALEERTRCVHLDRRPENVSEHSHMLSKVAPVLVAELYPDVDDATIWRVAFLAGLHDDLENWVLDVATDRATDEALLSKEAREDRAYEQALEEYADVPVYINGLVEYEAQETFAARAVRCVDKLMVFLIQLPTDGAAIAGSYTPEEYEAMYTARHARLLEEYPDMGALLSVYLELAAEVVRHAWPDEPIAILPAAH